MSDVNVQNDLKSQQATVEFQENSCCLNSEGRSELFNGQFTDSFRSRLEFELFDHIQITVGPFNRL